MADIRNFRESAIRKDDKKDLSAGRMPQAQSGVEEVRYCAYNQTRERFVSTDVEAADFSSAILADRLSNFKSGSGAALWIIPFRGLSPTSVRFPIDLVYLNERFIVLDAVESFPISMADSSVPLAASVLALPAHSIASVGILAGDQLILSTPEEMKRHLRQLQTSRADVPAQPSLVRGQSTPSRTQPSTQEAAGQVLQFEDRIQSRSSSFDGAPAKAIADQIFAVRAQIPTPNPEQPALKGAGKPKNWWQRLLSDEPPDPRKATREPLPGLVAYFFTGGVPAAHGVRNISSTGLYVLTEERWYIGTVIRITLTDRHEPTIERSITLNAKVVRWGNDGAGLQFILQGKKDQPRGKLPAHIDPTDSASTAQLEQFLQHYRAKL
ncbi:MAG TPA: PilZ domain-containing protein [Terracidiphilus sp.]|nr:PilZ domain-containing protein [Terracidiphilus sp.]